MNNKNNKLKSVDAGFTLIELMIAMVIGLFLLAGIANSYISTKKASMNRSAASLLEDNGRLALEIIRNSLEHTAYAPNLLLATPFITVPTDVVADTCPNGAVNVLKPSILKVTADNDGAGLDTIGTVFHGNDEVNTDCSGNVLPISTATVERCSLRPLPQINTVPEAAKIYNSFYVDSSKDTLECAGSRTNSPVTIADGVEKIQFLYGVDINTDGTVDRYANATTINADTTDNVDWSGVIAIQVAILVRTVKPVKPKAETKKYTLLDTMVTAPNDKFQRAVFSTTIILQNAF